ncbi:MAG TPA: 50S ribosomal protein L9 [candidate division Zixibacteria bacterium]|nr:50S ribosomal protein L9 [candidate division Zixibacteria bacterium]
MKVILTEDVKSLGIAGDILDVADGYARNFLIPKKLVVPANKGNLARVEQIKTARANREEKRKKTLSVLAEKIEGFSVDISVQVGEDDRVFGAVTTQMIADALRAKGFNIERKTIQLEEPIKQLGVYNVEIKLHADVRPQVRVWVVSA